LGLTMPSKGTLVGRVLTEALPHGRMPAVMARTLRSAPSATGLRTLLVYQQVGATRYVDIAGFPGRTVGLAPDTSASLRSSAPARCSQAVGRRSVGAQRFRARSAVTRALRCVHVGWEASPTGRALALYNGATATPHMQVSLTSLK